jgi:hypothetical protein
MNPIRQCPGPACTPTATPAAPAWSSTKTRTTCSVSELEALPWATNGRNGVAFRAKEIKAAGGLSSVKTG